MPVVSFTCNGTPVRVSVRDDERLLETLRGRLGLTSLKDGCHPQGQCGACLAIVNGHARVTCTEPTADVEGGEVLTLEGLSPEERAHIVRAFEAAAAGQCGYCLPGIALHAHTFLAKHPCPTRAEIARGLDMHLCRCGGYGRIVTAIEKLAALRRGEDIPPPEGAGTPGGVGAPIGRLDAAELVLGTRLFTGDLTLPGMLHGALVLSPHARARVLRIDTAAAAALPGVVAVAAARDVPGDRWQGLLEHDWPLLVAEGEEVRCTGDVLAVIAADSEATAREAAALVQVTCEPLPPVLSPEEALAEGAPRVNPRHDNLLGTSRIQTPPPRSRRAPTSRAPPSARSASSTSSSRPSAPSPSRAAAASPSGRRARASSTTGARSPASSASPRTTSS
jgi:aerobic-type carbon monoxide dehydrogenase small subunit (CoxS/CutS family)